MNVASLVVGIATLLISTTAHAGIMSVRTERPDWYKASMDNTSWNITLEGEIDRGAPGRVAEALRQAGSDGADVYISSPGGNVLAGMEIGRLIRRAGANTHIGTPVPDPSKNPLGKPPMKHVSGYCFSACALAFLGGVYRYTVAGSEYGVHRFASSSGPTNSDLDIAQIQSAAIAAYIREMEVDAALFDLMVQEGKDSVRILTDAEMSGLNVINNGRKRAEWSIEAIEGGQYLRGVQQTVYGEGKAILACKDGQMMYQSFYQVGEEKAKSIAAGGWYHSLLVNAKTLALPDLVAAKASARQIFAMFPLTQEQAMAIASSSSMGHAMQVSRDAPIFVGYQIDIPASASKKVGAFIRNCLHR